MNQITKSLCHGATSSKKRAYNKDYYRTHKDYWKDYYSKGMTVGRSGRDKYTSGNSTGVARRGNGLGGGPVGSFNKNARETLYENVETENILTEQTPEQWSQAHQTSSGKRKLSATLKKIGNQAVSYLKSGAKGISKAGKEFVDNWKTGVKSIFKKKPVVVTNTWSGTVGGQPVSGSNSFVLRNTRR